MTARFRDTYNQNPSKKYIYHPTNKADGKFCVFEVTIKNFYF